MERLKRFDGRFMKNYSTEKGVIYRDLYDNKNKLCYKLPFNEYENLKAFHAGVGEYLNNNFNKSYEFLYKSANKGYVPAICFLGSDEALAKNDYYEAFKFYDKAVEEDEKNGRNYSDFKISNLEEAKEYFESLNERQKENARRNFERDFYYSQLGHSIDNDTSISFLQQKKLRKFISRNHLEEIQENQSKIGYTQAFIAKKYGKELFADKDVSEFNIKNITKGLRKGDLVSGFEFAYLFELAKEGNKEAQFAMAEYNSLYLLRLPESSFKECYYQRKINGNEVLPPYEEPITRALKLYENSAKQGHVLSGYILAFYLMDGRFVEKDNEEAYFWYKNSNNKDGKKTLRKVVENYEQYYYTKLDDYERVPRIDSYNMGQEGMTRIMNFLKMKKQEERALKEKELEQ